MNTPDFNPSEAAQDAPALFSLEQLCRTCAVQTEFVMTMLDEGVVQPVQGQTPESWLFGETEVHHLTVAWRLQRDLGVNPAGAALALRLLDEMETLRAQLAAHLAGQAPHR